MTRWLRPLLVCVALLASLAGVGCSDDADQVELRLFPCEFAGVEPRSVVVEITGYDGSGALVESFEVGFDDIDADTFADGYASVGYRKDARVVRAQFRLGWFSSPTAGSLAAAEAVAVYDDVVVPELGEVVNLTALAGDCSELAGDGDGDPSGDGDGDPTGDGDGDGDPTGDGDGDGDPSGDGDGDGDPTTGDGDGDPSGDGDGDPTTGDGDGDPGETLPMVGDPCDPFSTPFQCVPELDGGAGTPLLCGPVSMQLESSQLWPSACAGLCPPGSSGPVDACAGVGHPAGCLCVPDTPQTCNMAELGCTGDGYVQLCLDGDVVIGECNGCTMTPGGYFTCTR